MANDQTVVRIVHDLTGAAWFGGTLFGALSVDAASRKAPDPMTRLDVAEGAWTRWQRVSTPMILAHLIAGSVLTVGNRKRLAGQRGAGRTTTAKAAVTGLALCSELTSRRLGRQLGTRSSDPVAGSTTPSGPTPEPTARVQKRLRTSQRATVALTAANVALTARMGEQQRPGQLVRGIVGRLNPAA